MTGCKTCKTLVKMSEIRGVKEIRSVADYLNALDTGYKWNTLALKYYFYKTTDPAPTDNYTRRDWDDTQQANFRTALAAWSSISALSLTETTVLAEADIKLILVDDPTYPYLGHAYFPVGATKGENYVSYNNATDKNFTVGGYDYITMVHEMGHTLGLAHPHDNGGTSTTFPGVSTWSDLGVNQQNQTVYTVMSYNDLNGPITPDTVQSYGFIGGPMAYDIQVMVNKYGNVAKNTGNNTYNLSATNAPGTYFEAIKDTSGIDTISAAGLNSGAVINLNAATLNADGGKLSRVGGVYGGYTIARDTHIENAVGSQREDIIIGNSGRNVIQGRGGNDRIHTGGGSDVVYAGGGNDRINVQGNRNRVFTQAGNNIVDATRAANTFVRGGNGNDTFFPGPGRNVFIGGRGLNRVIIRARRSGFRIIRRRSGVYHIRPRTRGLARRFGLVTIIRGVRVIRFNDRRVVLR